MKKSSYWKIQLHKVPGKPCVRKISPLIAMSGSSYHDFQASVNDAWDLGDDDIIAGVANTKISKTISQTAAINVINIHRNNSKASTPASAKSVENVTLAEKSKSETNPPKKNVKLSGNASSIKYPGQPKPFRYSCISYKDESNESKIERFMQALSSSLLELHELKQLSWSGVPVKIRAVTWRLLSGYLPANAERRKETLERKRAEYWQFVKQYYEGDRDEETYHQIHIDIPRMSPLVALFQQNTVQVMFERILYIWAIRHPASGYVQGINDLVTPFFIVFLQEVVPFGEDLDNFSLDKLSEEQRNIIEADSFWCLSKFLDSIQDNYIFAQLGIQYKVKQLKELIQRVDIQLHEHLQSHGIDYLQFSFRWMNNLLTRELPLPCTIRLWDTYLAESDGFATFQLYVCAAFLLNWKDHLLKEHDFQGLMVLLQNVPTQNWNDSHISVLVAEAYRLKFAFADAPKHLQNNCAAPTLSDR